ncbi:MAG: PorP/SprF family type IX secretion system membrane protein [Saprospiraceae bacterium]
MMKSIQSYFILLFLLSTYNLISQDTHFSNYHFTPLTVNPALTGAFNGTYRIGGIYKDNYTVAQNANGYHTINVFADSPIMRGFRSVDWIGIGLETNQLSFSGSTRSDEGFAEKYSLNWTNIKLSGSYHFSLNKKQSRILTLGLQMNMSSLNFNEAALRNINNTRYGIATGMVDPDMTAYLKSITTTTSSGTKANTGFRDFITGLLFVDKTKTTELRLGFAVEGITRPRYGVQNGGSYRKPFGFHAHGEYEMTISKNMKIIPGAYFYSLGAANALNINGRVKYLVNAEKDFVLVGGAGVRNLRQALLLVGAEFGNYQVGGSFDFDLAESAIASQGFHGFEVSLIYTGIVYKKPKTTPIILCPRL